MLLLLALGLHRVSSVVIGIDLNSAPAAYRSESRSFVAFDHERTKLVVEALWFLKVQEVTLGARRAVKLMWASQQKWRSGASVRKSGVSARADTTKAG